MASIRVRDTRSGATTYSVLWRDPDTGKQTSYALQSHQEAENFRRLIEANGGHLGPTTEMLDAIARKVPLIRDIIEDHLEYQPSITARTRHDYQRDAERYIVPYLGNVPLDKLGARDINRWLGILVKMQRPDGNLISDKTIANIHGLLSTAIHGYLETAEGRAIRSDNPSKGIRLPRRSEHTAVEMVCLSRTEWATLDKELGKVLDGHYQPLFRMLAGTGIRWGEAAALTVSDLSLADAVRTVRISKALKRDENSREYVGPTKTKMSRRTIQLADVLADELTELTAKLPGDALVFTSRTGKVIRHSNIRQFGWLPAIKAAQNREVYGIKALTHTPRVHDLRHSYASWQLAAGISMFTVQRNLGHEQITTTTNTYGHLLPEQRQSAAMAANAVLDW